MNLPRRDDDELDRLLAGREPAEHAPLGAVLRSLRAELDEVPAPAIADRHLAAITAAATEAAHQPPHAAEPAGPAGVWRGRIRRVLGLTVVKIGFSVGIAAAATGGLAGTGNLPDPVQEVAVDLAERIGIRLPSPATERAGAVDADDDAPGQDGADSVATTPDGSGARPDHAGSPGDGRADPPVGGVPGSPPTAPPTDRPGGGRPDTATPPPHAPAGPPEDAGDRGDDAPGRDAAPGRDGAPGDAAPGHEGAPDDGEEDAGGSDRDGVPAQPLPADPAPGDPDGDRGDTGSPASAGSPVAPVAPGTPPGH